jgi:hypothetical protein
LANPFASKRQSEDLQIQLDPTASSSPGVAQFRVGSALAMPGNAVQFFDALTLYGEYFTRPLVDGRRDNAPDAARVDEFSYYRSFLTRHMSVYGWEVIMEFDAQFRGLVWSQNQGQVFDRSHDERLVRLSDVGDYRERLNILRDQAAARKPTVPTPSSAPPSKPPAKERKLPPADPKPTGQVCRKFQQGRCSKTPCVWGHTH